MDYQKFKSSILKVSRVLQLESDLQSLIKNIIDAASDLTGCEAASVVLYDEVKNVLRFYYASGSKGWLLKDMVIPPGRGIVGWVFENEKPLIVKEPYSDKRFNPEIDKKTGFITKNLSCYPLTYRGKKLGVIEFVNKPGDFLDSDLESMEFISTVASIAVSNFFVYSKLDTENVIKSDFLNFISHKLRTPLTSISSSVGLLKEGNTRVIDILEKNLYRLQVMVEKIFSVMDAIGAVETQEFDISDVIKEVAQKIKGSIYIDVPSYKIKADRVAFFKVFYELIENAFKFNSKDVKEVKIYMQDGKLIVEDNGDGIHEKNLKNIFELFYQAERYFTGNVEGIGIGLWFVKRVIDKYGFKINVESSLKKGSRFIIEFS